MRAWFANSLQYGDNGFEVANMENRKFKINVSEMTNTLIEAFATCATDCISADTHTL